MQITKTTTRGPRAWLSFLSWIWGDDRASIDALRRLFAEVLNGPGPQLFAIVGPVCSGKSTIARVLHALGGEKVNSIESGELRNTFALASILDNDILIVDGADIDSTRVVERLLATQPGDTVVVDRKYQDPVNVVFATRVLLISNELPRLLAQRATVVVRTPRSFRVPHGRDLDAEFRGELAAIRRWASPATRRPTP